MTEDKQPLSIRGMQDKVDDWIKTYGVRYFSPLTNLGILMEECGELARVITRLHGEQSSKSGEQLCLADEMADVLWVLSCLANQSGIDLEQAFWENLKKKTSRDAQRHLCNPKLKS